MKRVVAALLIINMVTVAFSDDNFGELNVEAGLQFVEKMNVNYKNPERDQKDETYYLKSGVILTAEYLICCEYFSESVESLKFGAGLSYLLPRNVDKKDTNISVSCFPVYFTLQANPFIGAHNKVFHGIFVKGNFGYNILFDFEDKDLINKYKIGKDEIDKNGGLYYGISLGYEFPFGLIIDLGYHVYSGNVKIEHYEATSERSGYFANDDIKRSNATLNIGYKFKIYLP
jgi:hypothetical protein